MEAKRGISVKFRDSKSKRRAEFNLRRFAGEKSIIFPKTIDESKRLHKERGLGKVYRTAKGREFFPTEDGWRHFCAFIDDLENAEPFSSRATRNDVFNNFNRAFAEIVFAGHLPDAIEDFLDYLSEDFVVSLTIRREQRFSQIRGIDLAADHIIFFAGSWLLPYKSVSLDGMSENSSEFKNRSLIMLNQIFDPDNTVIVGLPHSGTSERAHLEDTTHSELVLSILTLFINMTYESAFCRLWILNRFERPEHGLSKHASFSIIRHNDSEQSEISLSIKYSEQCFQISEEIISHWYDRFGLGYLNYFVTQKRSQNNELHKQFLNAILYYRQAAIARTLELQISILWICVECFFTSDNKNVLKAVLPKLTSMTASVLPKDSWPGSAKSPLELEKIFKKLYRYRSKTLHHAGTGHVTWKDVQDFSVVVGAIILGIFGKMVSGLTTIDEIRNTA